MESERFVARRLVSIRGLLSPPHKPFLEFPAQACKTTPLLADHPHFRELSGPGCDFSPSSVPYYPKTPYNANFGPAGQKRGRWIHCAGLFRVPAYFSARKIGRLACRCARARPAPASAASQNVVLVQLAVTAAERNIWFAPELSAFAGSVDAGLRQYIRPLSGTSWVPGHDGLRAPRSS